METVGRLAAFAPAHHGPKVWVRALYQPGRFTDGDQDDPLAWLCTDLDGSDCAWEPRLVPPADAVVVTKTNVDAGTSAAFVEATVQLTRLRMAGPVVFDTPDAGRD